MRSKQETFILYVKIRVSPKNGGFGKAKESQSILGDTAELKMRRKHSIAWHGVA